MFFNYDDGHLNVKFNIVFSSGDPSSYAVLILQSDFERPYLGLLDSKLGTMFFDFG